MAFFKNIPYELVLGWRYTRAGRATRRNGFISFISGVSMMGIGLGVAALIIVLSVMNGFQKEVRDRMLGVLSHIEVFDPDGLGIPDLPATLAAARQHPEVVGVAPFVSAQALLARGEDMKGVLVRGIAPALEPSVTDLASPAMAETFTRLVPGEFGVVLMMGGSIPGETKTLAISIYDRVQAFDIQSADRMALLLFLMSLLAVAASFFATSRLTRRTASASGAMILGRSTANSSHSGSF